MSWPAKLVLVRHAESEGNVRPDLDDRARYEVPTQEYPLTELGRAQARLTGEYVREVYGEFDAYYTSYYTRAKETMSLMYPKAKVYEDSRLAEAQRGIWQTYTRDEIDRFFPKEVARKEKEGLYHHRPIGGENWPDIEQRIHSFLGTLNRDYDGQRVLIVVHGFWLILFQKLVHRFTIEEALDRYKHRVVENASVTAYSGALRDGKSRMNLDQEAFVPWEGNL
ncbi:MAG: histidine phosphatase family protein [Patescibacteria group bacterium]